MIQFFLTIAAAVVVISVSIWRRQSKVRASRRDDGLHDGDIIITRKL